MSLAGTLEELSFADLLQAVGSGTSGRLTVSRRQELGVLLLRGGRIVYATSNSARETLGRLLVSRGLIDEAALEEALEAQHRHKGDAAARADLCWRRGRSKRRAWPEVLRQQIEGVLSELIRWTGGFFKFEPLEVPAQAAGEPEVDITDLLLQEGAAAEGVMLEAVRLVDEASRPERRPPSPAAKQLAALKAVLAGLRRPGSHNELSQQLLRVAGGVFGRAVLFAVLSDGFRGLGQTGVALDEQDPGAAVHALLLPWESPSVLTHVAERQETFRGRLDPSAGNRALLAGLGGGEPGEAAALPLLVGNRPRSSSTATTSPIAARSATSTSWSSWRSRWDWRWRRTSSSCGCGRWKRKPVLGR